MIEREKHVGEDDLKRIGGKMKSITLTHHCAKQNIIF